MKFILKLLLIIIVITACIGSVFVYNGYCMYKDVTTQNSICNKVSEIKSDDSYIQLNQVPQDFKNAVISVEDHRFESHGPIDIIGITRAIVTNIRNKEFREGGSTITQQVAKNMYFTTESNIVTRKFAEFFVAYNLERMYSKNEIFEIYMNTIYFGDGYYGIKEATNGYLNKEPKDMSLDECTLLAGVPNAPSVYAPTVNASLARNRQQKVISTMVKNKYLTQDQADILLSTIAASDIYNPNRN